MPDVVGALIPAVAASFENAILVFRPIKSLSFFLSEPTSDRKLPSIKYFYGGCCKLKFICFGKVPALWITVKCDIYVMRVNEAVAFHGSRITEALVFKGIYNCGTYFRYIGEYSVVSISLFEVFNCSD